MSSPSHFGPYRVVRKIGAGGMGTVYEAIQESIERRVAIKVLHAEYAQNADVTARFFNEARAVNRIEHPGLVQISDYGKLPDGTAYLVMEYLKGESLGGRLGRGRLRVAPTLIIAWQVADALSAAHDKGIVHRDLKPDNVMLVADTVAPGGERAKLVDFGIAKLAEAAATGQIKTSTSAVMGTPRYMAPEQCKGASKVDGKADVYALGIMLFEMLAGQPPFDGEGAGEIIAKHIYSPAPPLQSIVTDLPAEVTLLVHRLIAKDKDQRPTMHEVFEELGMLVATYAQAEIRLRPSWSGSAELADTEPFALRNDSTFGHASGQIPRLGARGFIRTVSLVVTGAFVLSGIGGFIVWHKSSPKTPANVTHTRVAQAPAAPVRPVAQRMVTWSIRSDPPGAEIIRVTDDKVLGRTPWQNQQPFAAGTEELRLKLSGYAQRFVTVDRGGHTEINERLDAQAPPAVGIKADSAPRPKAPKQPVKKTAAKSIPPTTRGQSHAPVQSED